MINLLFVFSLLFSGCPLPEIEDGNSKMNVASDTSRILIVFLSRTNNTKTIAEIIRQNVGGKLVALELETPYPANYGATVQQVVRENESGYLPPLKTRIDSIRNYNVVFVGFPTWGMKLPPPIKSFLHLYDLSGKTIVPFNTNDGYGIGSSFDTVKELCPNSTVLEGFTTKGGIENGQVLLGNDEKKKEAEGKVKQWLQKLNLVTKAPQEISVCLLVNDHQ